MVKSIKMSFLKKNKTIILLLLILFVAVFFRVWHLDSAPPGLYPDEAMNANNALESLNDNQFKLFYPENNGREGLYIWFVAFIFKIFGPSVWSFRLASAVLGILTIPALYLLTKELFHPFPRHREDSSPHSCHRERPLGARQSRFISIQYFNEKIALLSAFFLSISFWHVNFSRIGFRAILVPLLMCFSFYFLLRAFRKNNLPNYILAGIFFGLGFYSYIAFRAAAIFLGIVLLARMISYWQKRRPISINWPNLWNKIYLKDGWWKVDVFLIIILLVALPMGFYFLQNPQDLTGRTGGVSVFSAEQPLIELGKSAVKVFFMFNVFGDWNWWHNYAGSPMLAWPIGILFILGIISAVKKLFLPEKERSIFLLSWFAIMLLPAVLTYEGMPHALRAIGIIPVVCILSSLGYCRLSEKISSMKIKGVKYFAAFLLIFIILYPGLKNFNKYFFDWAKRPETASAFSYDYVKIGQYLNTLPAQVKKYVIVNEKGTPYYGLSIAAQTPIFIESAEFGQPRAIYLPWQEIGQIEISPHKTVILTLHNHYSLEEIQKIFPQGKISQDEPERLEIE
ncbi:MAG: glycosyltransferase family 39 protein [Patescibacteria group bacterium]|nr:glycosyltransferase family 39 protein [Patescibacteria group bacterium]